MSGQYVIAAVCSVCGRDEVFRPDLTPGGAYCADHLPKNFCVDQIGTAKKWYVKLKEPRERVN